MSALLISKLQAIVATSKIQESIDLIIGVAKQYKESESMGEVCRPYELMLSPRPTLQKKYDMVLDKMTTLGSIGTPRPLISANSPINSYITGLSPILPQLQLTVHKPEKLAKLAPTHSNGKEEDDKDSKASSHVKSFNLEMPETSSIDFEEDVKTEVLSAAKLMLKLKYTNSSECRKETTTLDVEVV